MAAAHGIEVEVCDAPEKVYRGADIVASVTSSAVPVGDGACLEPGTHLVNIGGGGLPDAASLARVDVYLRFGNAPPPTSRPDLVIDDEHLTWAAQSGGAGAKRAKRAHGVSLADRLVWLADLASGKHPGRTSDAQVTYSERGNLQGAQFYAVAGTIYEAARAAGLGHEIPTEWLLQDIRN
jgi:alanine dehydrogenase